MAKIKLIHPKTETVREIDEGDKVRLKILTRAGFVDAATHRPLPTAVLAPEPTVAEVVESQGEEAKIPGAETTAEKAIHRGEPSPLEGMSMKELRALAKERGVKVPFGVRSKKGIAALLAG